uniref:uncharacterized protein isoform X3 n=1 Tax=Pristiophorus japonicus TaxID=55135 RepID=UPI00398F3703
MAAQKIDERKRCHNFSEDDLNKLLDEVEAKRRRLIGNVKCRAPRKDSLLAWNEVAEALSANSTVPRSAEQCRKKLSDLTRSAKSKMAHNARELLLTGGGVGGVAFLKEMSEQEERVSQLLGISSSSVSGAQSDIEARKGGQLSLDTWGPDGGESAAADGVDMVSEAEEEEETKWHPEEEEIVHPQWEGRRSDVITPSPTLHLQSADVALEHEDKPQIIVSPSLGPSGSVRDTHDCPLTGSRQADAVGAVRGNVIDPSDLSGAEQSPIHAPQSAVRQGTPQPHVDPELEEDLIVEEVRQTLVDQHNKYLDSLASMRQEMKDFGMNLCNQLAINTQTITDQLALNNQTMCTQFSLSMKAISDQLAHINQTNLNHFSRMEDNLSHLSQTLIQVFELHRSDSAATRTTTIEPPLPSLSANMVQTHGPAAVPITDATSNAAFEQQHPSYELPADERQTTHRGRALGTRGVRSRGRARRRRQ